MRRVAICRQAMARSGRAWLGRVARTSRARTFIVERTQIRVGPFSTVGTRRALVTIAFDLPLPQIVRPAFCQRRSFVFLPCCKGNRPFLYVAFAYSTA